MIIDFHTHVFPPFLKEKRQDLFSSEPAFKTLYNSPNAKLVGARELINDMDEEGIHKSVIFGFPWEDAEIFRRHNDYILESVNGNADRLIGFCCFSPLSPDGPFRCRRTGCLRLRTVIKCHRCIKRGHGLMSAI